MTADCAGVLACGVSKGVTKGDGVKGTAGGGGCFELTLGVYLLFPRDSSEIHLKFFYTYLYIYKYGGGMEVSENQFSLTGQPLLQQIITFTGLNPSWVKQELDLVLEEYGDDVGQGPEKLTLAQLREVLVAFLETTQSDLIEKGVIVEEEAYVKLR